MGCLSDSVQMHRHVGNTDLTLAPGAAAASGTAITFTLPGDYPATAGRAWLFDLLGAGSWSQPLLTSSPVQFARIGVGAPADANYIGYLFKNAADTTHPMLQLKQASSSGDASLRFAETQSYAIGIDASLSHAFAMSWASDENAVLGSQNFLRCREGIVDMLLASTVWSSADVNDCINTGAPRVLIGGSTHNNIGLLSLIARGTNTFGVRLAVGRTRSTSNALDGNTILQANDCVFDIDTYGADGVTYKQAARITVHVDGTPGTNDMPGRIGFWTTPDGTATAVENMRLTNAGFLGVGLGTGNAPATRLDIGEGAMTLKEMTAPGAGAANTCRIYAVDNGSGKTQLMAQFATGSAVQLAIEP